METVGSDVEFWDSARWLAGGAAPPAGQGQEHRGCPVTCCSAARWGTTSGR